MRKAVAGRADEGSLDLRNGQSAPTLLSPSCLFCWHSALLFHDAHHPPPRSTVILQMILGDGNSPTPDRDLLADSKRTSSQSQIKRVASNGRVHRLQYGANGGLMGGTIQRSKVGGRVAASSSYMGGTLASSLYGPSNVKHRTSDRAVPKKKAKEAERDLSVLPTPASVASPLQRPSLKQQEKETSAAAAPAPAAMTTINGTTGHVPAARRSSSSNRSRKSNGSSRVAKMNNTGGGHALLGAVAVSKRPFDTEFSDESTDTDWTDDGSDEGSGGSNEQDQVGQSEADKMLAFAAAEAARERSLFAKLDRRSYTDLERSRTQPSLLSMIFHPDPQLFPPDHPYRHTRSTQDILAHAIGPRSTSSSSVPYQQPKLQAMQKTKSATAGPVQATVIATSHSTSNMQEAARATERQRSPLRLRGRPENVDVEESDSDGDGNDLHVSQSVAQKRLEMLHKQQNGRRASASASNGKPPQAGGGRPSMMKMMMMDQVAPGPGPGPTPLARVATEPITVAYPYNLPAPQPPSTPRTTRRTMLTHELSESLRRNLLWERQVSRLRPVGNGVNRRNSPGIPAAAANGAAAAAAMNGSANGAATGGSASANTSGGNGTGTGTKVAEEQEKRRREERYQSWTDTYHTSGW